MSTLLKIILPVICILLTACGGGDTFRVTGEIPDLGTQNLNIVYYGDGAFRNIRSPLVDGKFMFDGKSRDLTAVYIFSSRYSLLGIVVAQNGDNISARFDINNPSQTVIKGNKPSELLSQWLSSNAELLASGESGAINASVKAFVEKNRTNIASTVLLMNYYNTTENFESADSLLKIIENKARPSYLAEGWINMLELAADSSTVTLSQGLEFFTIEDSLMSLPVSGKTLFLYLPSNNLRDSRTDVKLKERYDYVKKDSLKVGVFEIDRAVTDTAQWKKTVRNDSLPWPRIWHPFNYLKLPLQQESSFLVADTAGNIIYNGSDMFAAFKIANMY